MDVFLSISDRPFGVPYHRDTPGSASYIDLKHEPGRIDEIPEGKQWPSLHRLLKQLNSPESKLMSLACGVFIYPPDATRALWSTYSYAGYCFADLSSNGDAREYFPQFFRFSQHRAELVHQAATVVFDLRPTLFIEQNIQGFSVDCVVRAWVSTEAEIKAIISDHFDALSSFLPVMGLAPSMPAPTN